MRSIIRPAMVALGCAASTPAFAVEEDVQLWTTLVVTGPIKGPLVANIEGGARFDRDVGRLGIAYIRPSIGYRVTPAVTLSLGYAHFTTFVDNARDVQEDRAWQQVEGRLGKLGSGSLTGRLRLEQRFVNTGSENGYRLRARLRYQGKLGTKGPDLVVQTEPFFGFNRTAWGQPDGLDQVRSFVGIVTPLAKGLSIETGYQNRYVRRIGRGDRVDHIVPVTMTVRF